MKRLCLLIFVFLFFANKLTAQTAASAIVDILFQSFFLIEVPSPFIYKNKTPTQT